jgi:hypothetical protein
MRLLQSKMRLIRIYILVSLFSYLFPISRALAQTGDTQGPAAVQSQAAVELKNPLQVETIEGLLRAIIAVVLVFAVPIIIFFIIYAGFLYVTARGNEQQVQQATRALLYALVGGLLILGAYVLIDIIANLVASIAAN